MLNHLDLNSLLRHATSTQRKKMQTKMWTKWSHEKPACWNSYGYESVFEKLRFRDGLVWTIGGLTVEIKLRFQISPA